MSLAHRRNDGEDSLEILQGVARYAHPTVSICEVVANRRRAFGVNLIHLFSYGGNPRVALVPERSAQRPQHHPREINIAILRRVHQIVRHLGVLRELFFELFARGFVPDELRERLLLILFPDERVLVPRANQLIHPGDDALRLAVQAKQSLHHFRVRRHVRLESEREGFVVSRWLFGRLEAGAVHPPREGVGAVQDVVREGAEKFGNVARRWLHDNVRRIENDVDLEQG